MQNKVLKLGELFSGSGGLALGASLANKLPGRSYTIAHKWAIDYDQDACKTYDFNIFHNKDTATCSDIRLVDFSNFCDVDVMAFGFPCNDFSIVGEQKGLCGNYGPLYYYCAKALDKFRPLCFVAENVTGLKSADNGKAFDMVLRTFSKVGEGYDLSVHLYRAENYGVPQKRHRIIIVGFKKTSNLRFKPPIPTHKIPITAKEALENLPDWLPNNESPKTSEKVIRRLMHIPPGGNAWSLSVPTELQIKTNARLSQIYKRLDPEKPSYTITGSGGGGTHVYHWEKLRALTNRERARLQSFPDDFIFFGSKESIRKQIGMAVPPLLSRVIFDAILMTIENRKYDFIDENIAFGDLLL